MSTTADDIAPAYAATTLAGSYENTVDLAAKVRGQSEVRVRVVLFDLIQANIHFSSPATSIQCLTTSAIRFSDIQSGDRARA
jgi:hypothetical protein